MMVDVGFGEDVGLLVGMRAGKRSFVKMTASETTGRRNKRVG